MDVNVHYCQSRHKHSAAYKIYIPQFFDVDRTRQNPTQCQPHKQPCNVKRDVQRLRRQFALHKHLVDRVAEQVECGNADKRQSEQSPRPPSGTQEHERHHQYNRYNRKALANHSITLFKNRFYYFIRFVRIVREHKDDHVAVCRENRVVELRHLGGHIILEPEFEVVQTSFNRSLGGFDVA